MPTGRPPATVLARLATGLALLLAAWSGWTVVASLRGSAETSVRYPVIDRVQALKTAVDSLQQQSLVLNTPGRRWRELFDRYRALEAGLKTGELPAGVAARGLLEGVRDRVREAEQMRTSLLLSSLDAGRRRELETDFRTLLGLASSDLERLGRDLRRAGVTPAPAARRPDPYLVGVCLLAILIATLLLVEYTGELRPRAPAVSLPPEATTLAATPRGVDPERLAAAVALRFNQLLTPINGYCELMLDSLAEADPLRNEVGEIHRAGQQAAVLARQLQAFGRLEEVEPRTLDLSDWLKSQEKALRDLAGPATRLAMELDAPGCTVRADPRQLRCIVDALTLNAAEAMPDGGTLRIRLAPIQKPAAEAFVLAEFTDSGKGMDSATRERLFEPLFTTKPGGRGSGLSLVTVRDVVERLGGSIEVSSEPGHGSVFRVYLPRMVEIPSGEAPPKVKAARA